MPNAVRVLQRLLPHYRVPVFAELAQHFDDFKVLYGDEHRKDSLRNVTVGPPWAVKVRNRYLSRECYVGDVTQWLSVGATIVVSGELGNVNLYQVLAKRRAKGYRVIIWTFGYDPRFGFHPRRRAEDAVRRRLYQAADAVLFYWEGGRRAVEAAMGPRESFFTAPNTLDTPTLRKLSNGLDAKGREKVRSELRLSSDAPHFVYIGRLLADKEIDRLLAAWRFVVAEEPTYQLSIIGDGPLRNTLEEMARALGICVRFVGEVTEPADVGAWLSASNALVMPGRLGLSVIHAFCFGVPVISQHKEGNFHGEGIGYLRDGENGRLVADGDIMGLSAAILELGRNTEIGAALSNGARRTAEQEGSLATMVQGFCNAIEYVNAKRQPCG
ncbi:MAG: glycosyltransferase family 4 protein [Steroidobacteraceae bacterium]|nr:glycosyltransferase family 4 protein [Steroidobacteraceae bacterium]